MKPLNRCRHACRPLEATAPGRTSGPTGYQDLRPRGRPRLITALVIAGLISGGLQPPAMAQKLINRGQIINTGTIAVRDSVLGLPASIGGSMRLTGENQLVPARTYQNLALTSPAVTTKWAEGNLFVSETLLIGPNVTFQVPADSAVTLGTASGRLTEQGYIAGSISKTVDLQGGTPSSDFGGIGASVSWSSTAPNATAVTRTSGIAISAGGNTSIQRYYDIAPANQTAVTTVDLAYVTDELQGQDPNALDVWRLPPGETRWRRQKSTISGTTLTISGLQAYGRFTFADTLHPLDPVTMFEWDPALFASLSPDSARGYVLQPVDSLFRVRVTDGFDQPVAGVTVTFSITGRPSGATGDGLSATSAVTDGDGVASTQLTLGDLSGKYIVTADVPAVPDILPVTFVGYTGSELLAMQYISGDAQTDSVRALLPSPFRVRLLANDSSFAVGEPVRFAILSRPSGDSLSMPADTVVSTNAQGEASLSFRLGSVAGSYVVRASALAADTLFRLFTAEATAGTPAQLIASNGPVLSDTVGQTMTPFYHYVLDQYGNPIQGATVNFAITSVPSGATGQALQNTSVVTDSNGLASTRLTLGTIAGTYVVQVTTPSVSGALNTVSVSAVPDAPALLALVSGSGQQKRVLSLVDSLLAVRIADAFGNAVAGVPVSYAYASVPSGATGQTFTQASDTSDAIGRADTRALLGNRAGTYTVRATSPAVPADTVLFQITALPGAAVQIASTVPLTATGTVLQLTAPFVYTVADSLGNGVPGVVVDYSLTAVPAGATGQFFSNSSVTSDSLGRVSNRLRLGDQAGLYTVRATSLSMPGVLLSESILANPAGAATIARVTGSGQSNQILTLVDSLLVVGVTDSLGNAVAGVPIDFAITTAPASASGQTLTSSRDTTDASGLATTRLQLGTKVGVYVVTATSASIPSGSADFSITATHGAAASLAATGQAVRDTVLKQASPLYVELLDVQQNPIPNAIVRYGLEAPQGATGQFLTADSSFTDSSGQASVTLNFGDKAGIYTVYAVADLLPGQVRQLSATAVAAGLAQFAAYETPVVPQQVYTRMDSSFVVRTMDAYGNPVAGVPIAFSVVDTPAYAVDFELSKYTDTTNAAGVAWTNLILGSKVGVYTVLAEVEGMPDVTFMATAIPGAPKSLAKVPTDSLAFPGTLAAPFHVTALDTGLNAVPGQIVSFSIVSTPAGATGQLLTTTTDTTDPSGQATTILRLGNRPGDYVVAATLADLQPALFTVTALDVRGNPNLDRRIDIADLTTIVDHALGNLTLTGGQFTAADLDSNGVVDLRDALIVRDYILSHGAWVLTDTMGIAAVEYPNIVLGTDQMSQSAAETGRAGVADDAHTSGSATNTTAQLEFTDVGIRLCLTNDVPVKGVQIYVRFKRAIPPPGRDIKFSRASMMNVFVAGTSTEVVAAAFNFSNTPIDPGSGPILRLPLAGLDTTDIDSVAIIVSTGTENLSTELAGDKVTRSEVLYPTTYTLYQNYPNPFNAQTTIEYEVPEVTGRIARVYIQIFNMLGEKVVTIDGGERDAGRYSVLWNGRDAYGNGLASGAYFYRLISIDPMNDKHFTSTKKMIYLK